MLFIHERDFCISTQNHKTKVVLDANKALSSFLILDIDLCFYFEKYFAEWILLSVHMHF